MSKTVLIIDEAQNYLPSVHTQRDDLQLSPMLKLVNQGRKLGIMGMFILQRPSVVEPSFIAQVNVLMAGYLGERQDQQVISVAMGLNREQAQYYDTIKKQTFLIRKSGNTPFPVLIPDLNIIPKITSHKNRNKILLSKNKKLNELLFKKEEKKAPIPLPQPGIEKDDAYHFMEVVNDNPCLTTTEYYELVKPHYGQQKANNIRKELEKNEYIKCHNVATGFRYHSGIEITEKGYSKFQLKKKLYFSRGADFPHTYICMRVKRYFEKKDCEVIKEMKMGLRYCDLFIKPKTIAEIAIGNKPENEARGIIDDLQYVDKVFVVGNDKVHLAQIRKKLPKEALERTEIKLFSEF